MTPEELLHAIFTAPICQECGDPIEDGECPHGKSLCDRCRLAWCYRCGTDYEDDHQDAIFDGVRDAARDREERNG